MAGLQQHRNTQGQTTGTDKHCCNCTEACLLHLKVSNTVLLQLILGNNPELPVNRHFEANPILVQPS